MTQQGNGNLRSENYQVERIDDVHTRLAHLEGKADHFATKADIAALETRDESLAKKESVANLETRMTKWVLGVVLGIVLVVLNLIVSGFIAVHRLLSSTTPP